MGLGLVSSGGGPFHLLVVLFFDVLILGMFIWMLVSWFMMMMPQLGGSRFFRFMDAMIGPLIDPIRKRIPSGSMGMLNVGYTIAFIFAWWALQRLAIVILQGLPPGW